MRVTKATLEVGLMGDKDTAGFAQERSSGEREQVQKSRHLGKEVFGSGAPIAISAIALAVSLLTYLDQHHANQVAQTSAEQAYAVKASFWSIIQPSPLQKPRPFNNSDFQTLRNLAEHGGSTSVVVVNGSGGEVSRADLLTLFMPVELSAASAIGVEIENQGDAPISTVNLVIKAQDSEGQNLGSRTVSVGTVPACSIDKVSSVQSATNDLVRTVFPRMVQSQGTTVVLDFPTIYVASMIFTDSLGVRWMRLQNGALSKYTRGQSGSISIEYPTGITRLSSCS